MIRRMGVYNTLLQEDKREICISRLMGQGKVIEEVKLLLNSMVRGQVSGVNSGRQNVKKSKIRKIR